MSIKEYLEKNKLDKDNLKKNIIKGVATGLTIAKLATALTSCNQPDQPVVDDTTIDITTTIPGDSIQNDSSNTPNTNIPLEEQHKVIQMAAQHDFDIKDKGLGSITVTNALSLDPNEFQAILGALGTPVTSTSNYIFPVTEDCYKEISSLALSYVSKLPAGYMASGGDNIITIRIDPKIINQGIVNELLDILSPYAIETAMIEEKECISNEDYNEFLKSLISQHDEFQNGIGAVRIIENRNNGVAEDTFEMSIYPYKSSMPPIPNFNNNTVAFSISEETFEKLTPYFTFDKWYNCTTSQHYNTTTNMHTINYNQSLSDTLDHQLYADLYNIFNLEMGQNTELNQ